MKEYYINSNKQTSTSGGNYEVHKCDCIYFKANKHNNNYVYLGYFSSSIEAVKYAKRVYHSYAQSIDGCYYCCKDSHSR